MDRSQRIRFVAVAVLGLFALFVGMIGAPLVAVLNFPSINDIGSDGSGINEHFTQAFQITHYTNIAIWSSLALAGVCFCYLLVMLAVWFIGPKNEPPDLAS